MPIIQPLTIKIGSKCESLVSRNRVINRPSGAAPMVIKTQDRVALPLQRYKPYDKRKKGKVMISCMGQEIPLQSNPNPRNDNKKPPTKASRIMSISFQLLR